MNLEEERLYSWFVSKYGLRFYEKASNELMKKKEKQSFWKKRFTTQEETDWKMQRTCELLDKEWNKRRTSKQGGKK